MKAPQPVTEQTAVADFKRAFQKLCHGHQPWRVFADFCEMAALSMANSIQIPSDAWNAREARYLEVVKAYGQDARVMSELLGITVVGLGESFEVDFLGQVFQELELANHWKGQFFTPMAIASVMARMISLDAPDLVRRRGFITVSEPAAGAGGMLIAFAGALAAQKVNPQRCMHFDAVDVDPTAAHMCYVQMSLLGIPGRVTIGDTLRMEFRETFVTPAHRLGLWDVKLRRGYALGSEMDEAVEPAAASGNHETWSEPPPPPPVVVTDERRGQMSLFGGGEPK